MYIAYLQGSSYLWGVGRNLSFESMLPQKYTHAGTVKRLAIR